MMTFNQYASKNIRIDQDANGLIALVPDQSGTWMTVRCVESKTSVHASHCSCHDFSKKQHCKHIDLVQAYWNKLYPQVETPVVVEAPKVAKNRKPRNGLVRKVRNSGLVRVEQKVEQPAKEEQQEVEAQAAVAEAESIVKTSSIELAAQKRSASLPRNQGFSILRR
jgi:hypothetical protein